MCEGLGRPEQSQRAAAGNGRQGSPELNPQNMRFHALFKWSHLCSNRKSAAASRAAAAAALCYCNSSAAAAVAVCYFFVGPVGGAVLGLSLIVGGFAACSFALSVAIGVTGDRPSGTDQPLIPQHRPHTVTPRPNTGSGSDSEAKVRKHGVAVFGQARVPARHVPRNTSCRHKPLHDHKKGVQYASTHPRTQEHMGVQPHQRFATHTDPSCSPHNAADHSLYWIVRKHGVVMSGQACVRTGRGGGGLLRNADRVSQSGPPRGSGTVDCDRDTLFSASGTLRGALTQTRGTQTSRWPALSDPRPPPVPLYLPFTPPPCVTFRPVVVSLRGPGQSPGLPFACCVGSLRSVGRCGRCSSWCRFRVRGSQ